MQRRLAHVRWSDQRDLRCALGPNDQRRTATCAASSGTLELFGQFLDAPLDIALEMVSSLVLWDRAQHLPQPLQALPGVARLTERSLYRLVLRREVGRHDVSAERPRHTPEADREEHRGGERESSQGRILPS